MARLATIGFESQRLTSAIATCGEGQGSSIAEGAVSINTATPRSGAACASCGPSARNYYDIKFSGVTGRSYFTRVAVRFSSVAPVGESLNFLQGFASGFATLFQVTLQESGEVRVFNNIAANWLIETTGFKPAANTWYLVELLVRVNAAGNGKFKLVIRANDGSVLYESAEIEANIGNTALTNFSAGHNGTTDSAVTVLLDDWVVNDDQGASENTFPGNGKIAMLKSVADNARTGWTAGGGSTEKLFDALDNTPPVGVASGSATNTSQIKDATSNATDTYEAKLAAYTTAVASGGAGLGGGEKIRLVHTLARGANSTATSRTLAVTGVSNPAVAEATVGTIAETAAAEPTAWTTLVSAPSYSPAVTQSEQPLLKVRKGTASTNVMMYDLVGLLVEFTPVTYVPLNATSGIASATVAAVAKTQIPLNASSGVASPTLALKAKTNVPLEASSGSSSATAAFTAKTQVPLSPSSGVASATVTVVVPVKIPLNPSSGVGSATLGIKAPITVILEPSSGKASTSLVLSSRQPINLLPSSGSSTASLLAHAKTYVTLGASSGVGSATAKVRVHIPAKLKIRVEGNWQTLV